MNLDDVVAADPLNLTIREIRSVSRRFNDATRARGSSDLAEVCATVALRLHVEERRAVLAQPRPWVETCELDILIEAAPYLTGHRTWEDDEVDTDWADL